MNPKFRYGAMTLSDMGLLESAVEQCVRESHFSMLEVGVWMGETAAGVKLLCDYLHKGISYHGIDIEDKTEGKRFGGFKLHVADSVNVPDSLLIDEDSNYPFDLVLLDACHCLFHVAMDIMNYAPMVRVGGGLLLHDTAPHLQHVQTNPFIHPAREPFLTAVLDAIEVVKFPWLGWELAGESYEEYANIGGMRYYRRIG